MELGGEARIAAWAGWALITEKESLWDNGLSTSARPLQRTIRVFFMLFVLANLVPRFGAPLMTQGSCCRLSYHHRYSVTCQEKDLDYFDVRKISSQEKESHLHPLFEDGHRKADLLVRAAYSLTTNAAIPVTEEWDNFTNRQQPVRIILEDSGTFSRCTNKHQISVSAF